MPRPTLHSSLAAIASIVTLGSIILSQWLLTSSTNVLAQPSPQPKPAPLEDRVGYPDGYDQWQQLYVFDRPDNRQVRVVYGNAEAAAADPSAGPNQVFPYGSVLVMETWRAKLDAAGNPEMDAQGRFQKDQLTGIFVERKEPGFGEAYQVARAGEWEWVAFRPDGAYSTPPQDSHACALCHQDAGATRDWVMRANLYFGGTSGAVPTTAAGQPIGRLSIQSYVFLPAIVTVSLGTTVTWGNDDPLAHTVTALDRSFDSGRMGPGTTFSYTFSQPGSIEYRCTLHQNMQGQILVE
jgi:plastocyanin